MIKEEKFDVAVIGSGPAGMFSAGFSAAGGRRVVLLEKNNNPGKKLLLTGKGRCNITNADYDKHRFIEKFGINGRFLYSSLNIFGVEKTIDFFNGIGLETKIERGNRVFPKSDSSRDVLSAILNFLNENRVHIKTSSKVEEVVHKSGKIEKLLLSETCIKAEKYILCTGGASYPKTGSDGEGIRWAKELGHTIVPLKPALTDVLTYENFTKDLDGLNLKNVKITVYKNGKKSDERFGEASFIQNGMSGPVILDMSKSIGNILNGDISLAIDFKPALDYRVLDRRLQRDFREQGNKAFKNSLDRLLPKKIIPVIVKLSGIDPSKKSSIITKTERISLLKLLKNLRLGVKGIGGFDRAIITSGGVALNEIDPRTMRSKIIDNLFFAGEIIDLDGPTGGYNLQVCWSTGYSAGISK